MDKETFTLKQVREQLGLSAYIVRKLCNAGLVRGIRRKRSGYRILNSEQVAELKMFVRMMQAGFSMEEMKKYARLQREGNETTQERKGMLETQKRQLWQQIQDLQDGIDFIERTVEILDEDNLENSNLS